METKTLHEALFLFQGKVHGVIKDSKNPHFKNTYASLEAVWNTIRPMLQECGLYVVQSPGEIKDGAIEVGTKIVHAKTGEQLATLMHMPLTKIDPQGAGSAITYACRYSLMAMLGLPPTDDDAEAAVGRDPERVIEEWGNRRGAEMLRAVRSKPINPQEPF